MTNASCGDVFVQCGKKLYECWGKWHETMKCKELVLYVDLSTAMSMTVQVDRYMGTAKAAKITRQRAEPKYQLSVS